MLLYEQFSMHVTPELKHKTTDHGTTTSIKAKLEQKIWIVLN